MLDDGEIADVLRAAKTIAVVGLSNDPDRPSYGVSAYMKSRGYRIIPVNPKESEVFGEKSYPTLADVPEPVDIVNIFRRPAAVPEVVAEAINKGGVRCVWMQQGIVNEEAAQSAESAGMSVVMDRCIYLDHRRLVG